MSKPDPRWHRFGQDWADPGAVKIERPASRTVALRDGRNGPDRRYLAARLDGEGNLYIEGQDIGPATASSNCWRGVGRGTGLGS